MGGLRRANYAISRDRVSWRAQGSVHGRSDSIDGQTRTCYQQTPGAAGPRGVRRAKSCASSHRRLHPLLLLLSAITYIAPCQSFFLHFRLSFFLLLALIALVDDRSLVLAIDTSDHTTKGNAAFGNMLRLPAFPQPPHGILLNSSPSSSPYSHTTSLPGTPHLISSLSSLSSSASSSSPHNSDADNYFLTTSLPAKDASAVPRGGSSYTPAIIGSAISRESSTKPTARPGSAPQTRKIRFAPLPEPRRDELLPDVFLDDSVENLNAFPASQDNVETPRGKTGSRPPSLLFCETQASGSDTTPTVSNTSLQLGAHFKPPVSPLPLSSLAGSDRDDSDWEIPQSPNVPLSSSVERLPQSCPESPISRRTDLPKEKKWSTKKLLKPLFMRNLSTEDVLTLGVNQLFRSSTRESDDGMSSGAATPSGASTPSRNRSRERSSFSEEKTNFGVPLCRSTSDNTASKKKRRSFMGFSNSNSSSEGGIWRTQSATGDMRRVQSRESVDSRRPRSGSAATVGNGGRKQLKMLNGRVYGAKRGARNVNSNLFGNARYVWDLLDVSRDADRCTRFSSDDEFVEWGYGGMGSVKTAAAVGALSKYGRLAGNSAFAAGAEASGWSENSRGRAPADPEDDGGGMTWVKRRREERERAKREAEAKVAQEAADKENVDVQQPQIEQVPQESSPVETPAEQPAEVSKSEVSEEGAVTSEPEHITTAITIPALHHSHSHSLSHSHGRTSMERVPSAASHVLRNAPERKDSQETARAISPPMPVSALADTQEMVVDMDNEVQIRSPRERRESASSASTDSTASDDDADVEDSPKDGDEDDEESDEVSSSSHVPCVMYVLTSSQEGARKTALSAGVEKISRHKDKTSAQDGAGAS